MLRMENYSEFEFYLQEEHFETISLTYERKSFEIHLAQYMDGYWTLKLRFSDRWFLLYHEIVAQITVN